MWPTTVTAWNPPRRSADALLGHWYVPSRQSTIEFFKAGDRYFARITEVGGSWKTKFAQAKGRIIISNLKFTEGEWTGGELINPDSNARFDLTLTLHNQDSATAVAYKGIRFLHRDFKMVRQQPGSEGFAGIP
ncbi:MAG: DUF2147 domain-containing protein [Rudanella sp.]|nr:DUF2147 domain-containing protein [Rudanella sp.]